MAFHPIARLQDVFEGCRIPARVSGLRLLLVQADDQHYLIEDRCPHMDTPLATGRIDGSRIICRSHGIAFCLTNGRAEGALSDTLDCLKFFPVAYDGNVVGIDL